MRCGELHQDAETMCQEELAEEYSFCPSCGRPCGSVSFSSSPISVEVEEETPSERSVPMVYRGWWPVKCRVEFEAMIPNVVVKQGTQVDLHAQRGQQLRFELLIPPLTSDRTLGRLTLVALEGPPSANGPRERHATVDVVARVIPKGTVELQQTCLFFREGLLERKLTVLNTGRSPRKIACVDVPVGYECQPSQGHIPGSEGGQPGRFEFTVRRLPTAAGLHDCVLRFRDDTGKEFDVVLRYKRNLRSTTQPMAVVAVDLGTTYTSVALRTVRHHNNLEDSVVLLSPPGSDVYRFPTHIWMASSGKQFDYGPKARETYMHNPGAGFLFCEAKRLLRHPDAVEAYPLPRRSEAVETARKQLGENWGQELITGYVGWLLKSIIYPALRARFGTPNVPVQYVFSIPVLDFAVGNQELYQRQLSAMKHCVRRAGCPEDQFEILFPFEPECAATALLHPRPGWPKLGTETWPIDKQTYLLVLDSGGGTTDIVLGVLELGDGGRLRLTVRRQLGVGNLHETFGGNRVTEILKHLLLDEYQKYADIIRNRTRGDGYSPVVILSKEPGELNDAEKLEKIDALKHRLACERSGWVSISRSFQIAVALLDDVCDKPLNSLRQAVREHVFGSEVHPAAVHYYLEVGGNSRLPPVVKWLQTLMQDYHGSDSTRHLVIPEEDRQLAVVLGAVWVPHPEVHNPMPLSVQLRVNNSAGGVSVAHVWQENMPMDLYLTPVKCVEEVPPGASLVAEMTAQDRPDHVLSRVSWRNAGVDRAAIEISGFIRDSRIVVTLERMDNGKTIVASDECPV